MPVPADLDGLPTILGSRTPAVRLRPSERGAFVASAGACEFSQCRGDVASASAGARLQNDRGLSPRQRHSNRGALLGFRAVLPGSAPSHGAVGGARRDRTSVTNPAPGGSDGPARDWRRNRPVWTVGSPNIWPVRTLVMRPDLMKALVCDGRQRFQTSKSRCVELDRLAAKLDAQQKACDDGGGRSSMPNRWRSARSRIHRLTMCKRPSMPYTGLIVHQQLRLRQPARGHWPVIADGEGDKEYVGVSNVTVVAEGPATEVARQPRPVRLTASRPASLPTGSYTARATGSRFAGQPSSTSRLLTPISRPGGSGSRPASRR